MVYWYENRSAYNHRLDTVSPIHGNYIPGIGPEHRDMHLLQSQNLALLYHFDGRTVIKVFLNYAISFFIVLSLASYQVISTNETGKSMRKLLSQLWLVILESQLISGVGFIVLNVWRYSFSYFYFLKAYHAYSTFTCLSAVLNSKN